MKITKQPTYAETLLAYGLLRLAERIMPRFYLA
jgi:hypothetical protein